MESAQLFALLKHPDAIVLLTACVAALVNGALGYGFSSITVPVALNFYSNKILNPALVIVEVVSNFGSLLMYRSTLAGVLKKIVPVLWGLLPGIALGSVLLNAVAVVALKAGTYAILLPLVLMQLRPRKWTLSLGKRTSAAFGFGLGILYSTTTISGPPLALFLNNQSLSPDEFRVSIAFLRVVESTFTLICYAFLNYLSADGIRLGLLLLPAVLFGIPIGRLLLGRIDHERFRFICMTVDAALVALGLTLSLQQLGLISDTVRLGVLAAAGGFVAGTLWQRFHIQRAEIQVTL